MEGNLQDFKLFSKDPEDIADNLKNDFKYAINTNPELENDIEEICNRNLLNEGKTILSRFHLKYILIFEELAKRNSLFEFSEDLHLNINSYFKHLDNSLSIKNSTDLKELKYILAFSEIMLGNIIEDNDISLAYESFFQLERRIKKKKLFDQFESYNIQHGNYEFKIDIKPIEPIELKNEFESQNLEVTYEL